jgi:hypothetical protein
MGEILVKLMCYKNFTVLAYNLLVDCDLCRIIKMVKPENLHIIKRYKI